MPVLFDLNWKGHGEWWWVLDKVLHDDYAVSQPLFESFWIFFPSLAVISCHWSKKRMTCPFDLSWALNCCKGHLRPSKQSVYKVLRSFCFCLRQWRGWKFLIQVLADLTDDWWSSFNVLGRCESVGLDPNSCGGVDTWPVASEDVALPMLLPEGYRCGYNQWSTPIWHAVQLKPPSIPDADFNVAGIKQNKVEFILRSLPL